MSSPAYCWSPSTAPTASTNCSRYATSAIPEEKGRSSRLPVNHVGRGHEPVTVVGRTRSFVAVSMEVLPFVAVADYVPRRPKLANLVRLVECRPRFWVPNQVRFLNLVRKFHLARVTPRHP